MARHAKTSVPLLEAMAEIRRLRSDAALGGSRSDAATSTKSDRSNNFAIFAGSDVADFVAYLDAHGLPSPAMLQKRLSGWGRP